MVSKSSIPVFARLKLQIITLKLGFENFLLDFLRLLLYKTPRDCKKILVFRTGSLGDSVNAIPAIQAVAASYPNGRIDILTNAGKKNLVGIGFLIDKDIYHEIIDYNEFSKKKLFNILRQKKYDLVVQLPQVDTTFFRLVRDLLVFSRIAPGGLGWFVSQTTWFRKTQAKHIIFKNENERLLTYLQKHKFKITQGTPVLTISDEDKQYTEKLLTELYSNEKKEKIAVVVGSKRPQNRWPISYFEEVIKHFSKTHQILLIGAAEDEELITPLKEYANVESFCGRLTPLQSAAVISQCDLTLSNDTGPMHMSYAVGTPTVALFSSRDLPGKWYPPQKDNRVFRAVGIKCEACFSETCKNNICMQAIHPQEVISAMEAILAESPLP